MKTKIITLFFLVFCIASCTNKTKISSKEMLVLSDSLITKKEEYVLNNVYKKLLKTNNDSISRNFLFSLANKYDDINIPEKYYEINFKIVQLATLANDSVHLAKALNGIGYYYENKSKLDSAFKYYLKTEKVYLKLKDTTHLGKLKMYKAGIYYATGNFVESEIEAVEALQQLSKIDNPRFNYQCYLIIALSLKETNNLPKALEYFDLAMNQLDVLEKKKQPNSTYLLRASCYNSKGRIYEKEKKYNKAIELYNKGLKVKNIRKTNPTLYATLLSNLAYTRMLNGSSNGTEKSLFEAYKIRDSAKSVSGIISSFNRIGEYYLYKKDTLKALEYIGSYYSLSKKAKNGTDELNSLKILSKVDPKNKQHYTEEYFKLGDSLQSNERKTRNKFARIVYETDKLEHENVVLYKRNTIIMSTAGLIIFLFGMTFFIFTLRTKNKELYYTQEQQIANEKIYQLILKQQSETDKAREEERERIAMELHDGIVNSIFTTRFNLMQLDSNSADQKELLVKELEKAESEIRRVSHDLKNNFLFEDKNLPEIISNLVALQKNEFNTKFELSIDKYINWSLVPSEHQIHIYRIIQEILQNTNKHAKAEVCYILMLKTNNKITIRIWDNGIGFNVEKMKQGIGLKNINQRVKELNGNLKVISKIDKGSTFEIVF